MEAARSRKALYILLFAAIITRLPLLFRPPLEFYSRPFIEDAYYSLSVARSIGHGHGITIDGVNATNGIQPLIVFLYAPFYAAFDDAIALRLCLLMAICLELLLAVTIHLFIRKTVHDTQLGWNAANIAVFLFFFSYSATVYSLNGLETALAAMSALAAALLYLRISGSEASPLWKYALAGATGGAAVLARIDLAFVVAGIAVFHLVSKRAAAGWPRRLLESLAFGCLALLVSSPWWLYNYFYFGSFTPTSGLSQRAVIPVSENIGALLQFLQNKLLLIGYLPYSRQLTTVHFIVAAFTGLVLFVFLAIPRFRSRANEFARAMIQSVRWRYFAVPMVGFAGMAVYYVLNFGAPHFLARYLFPVTVLWFALAGIAVATLLRLVGESKPGIAKSAGAAAAILTLAVYVLPYSWNFSENKARQNDFLMVSEYISHALPVRCRIGMGQSGTAGYFNANIVNLDGKVNYSVYMARQGKGLCAYLDSARFDYLIDWQHFFDTVDSCGMLAAYTKTDSAGRFLIYRRIP